MGTAPSPSEDRPANVAEIVLTGGPGGGKTTALRLLSSLLGRSGLRVITVPEVATIIINRGTFDIAAISRQDSDANCRFQRELFTTHRNLRRRALKRAAERSQRTVILYDRGELDGRAWHDHDCFDTLAAENQTTVAAVRDSYSAVMHLVTAAAGAENAYTLANNAARWESAAEAAARDAKVIQVWKDHPNFRLIDNRGDFADKVDRLVQATLAALNLPTQLIIDLSGRTPDVEAMTVDGTDAVAMVGPEAVPA